MNMTDITAYDNQFYPTPESVAEKMLEGIDFNFVKTVLEPSAGKGDLILALAKKFHAKKGYHSDPLDVDAIEIDPYLREICKYNFSEQKKQEYYKPIREIENKRYDETTDADRANKNFLKNEVDILNSVDLHMVHDDFLTYRSFKEYDLILMNPPFAEGDRHLLKALEMQKDGGSVICLLNAETIRNPHTPTRMLLRQKLSELNADITYIDDAFSTDAERKASVDCAVIRCVIPYQKRESTIFERMKKAADAYHIPDPELKALVSSDEIEQAIAMYNAEVAATTEFIKEYFALKPYIQRSLEDTHTSDSWPILTLTVCDDNQYRGFDHQKYMRTVRLKYWKAFFKNDKFTGKLTSNLREQYYKDVNRMADYEFSAFNIKQVLCEMNVSMQQGVKDTILNLFEKLTVEHHWYPECSQNRHYYNGWKTNKAHKIGKKSIIPGYNLYSSYSWNKDKGFDAREAYNILSDIEKAFDYLDGGQFKGNRYGMESFLTHASERRQSRNIECTYFLVDIYKKGTVHIKFRPEAMPLVERLNIYAAQNKAWLPPSYGKKTYSNMTAEEKAVIDDFQGEQSYNEVLKKKDFYLSDPVSSVPLLTA